MTLTARLTRQPLPMTPMPPPTRRGPLPTLPPRLRGLLAATAGCSPYLKGLMAREADWLRAVVADAPEATLEAVLDAPAPPATDTLGIALRQMPSGGSRCWPRCATWAGSGRWKR
jgi:glutamate-ammonia-ligase adenylyltransferase